MLYQGVQVQTAQTAEPKTIPAPVGGLNGRDSLANMAELDAYQLDNMFPGTSTCSVRQGCSEHQPDIGGPVSSLETYSSGAGQVMLAFAKPFVYDVTVEGIKASRKVDLNSDETVAVMMSTVA